MAFIVMSSCNSSNNNNSDTSDSASVSNVPKTVIKVTKQYVTLKDGTVQEYPVNASVEFNEKELAVNFADSASKNFTIQVLSLEKKVEGTMLKVRDSKYFEVFISSGAQPQITFSSDRGMGNMTLM